MVKDVIVIYIIQEKKWFSQAWNVIFRILENQYLTKVVLNFKKAL